MIAFLLPGIAWSEPIAAVHLMSGADWAVTPSGLLVAGSIVVLLLEMVKAGRANRSIVDHALSALIFIAMVAEFLLVRQAASGTFFLLVVIGFVDLVGGVA